MERRMTEKALKRKTTEPFAQTSYFITFSLSSANNAHLYRFEQGI
jgi:hypothetical protein